MTAETSDQKGRTPIDPNQDPPAQQPPVADPHARDIAERSPEGIPGDPKVGSRAVARTIVGFAVLAMFSAVLVAVFVNRWLGLAVGILAFGLLLANPVFWAAILRAREREGT